MSKLGSLYIRMGEPEGELCGGTCEIDDWAADEIERLRAELKAAAFCDARCSWVEHHPGCVFSERDALRVELDALKAAPPSVPDGWQLVPVEPTEAMFREMTDPYIAINGDNRKAFDGAYRAMLAAAPKPGEPT